LESKLNKTRYLLLAAGRGSRMKKLTSSKPKCLVKVAGKTILDWQIKSIQKSQISKVQIITGYLSDKLKVPYEKIHNKNWKNTNMVYSMLLSNDFNGDTIVSYSDIIYHKSYINKLMKCKYDICVLADIDWKSLWMQRMNNPLDDAEKFIAENNFLKSIGSRTNNYKNIQAQYMGLIKFSKQGYQSLKKHYYNLTIDQQKSIDMTSMLSLLLSKNVKIRVCYINGKWIEADSTEDVKLYNKILNNNQNWSHDFR
jgi:choline kinase